MKVRARNVIVCIFEISNTITLARKFFLVADITSITNNTKVKIDLGPPCPFKLFNNQGRLVHDYKLNHIQF